MIETKHEIRPSRMWYVLAAGLCCAAIAAMVVAVTGCLTGIIPALMSGQQFLAPAAMTLTIDEPGEYVIWHDSVAFFEGKTYSSPPGLPAGATISVTNDQTGKELTLMKRAAASETSPNHQRQSVCSFLAEMAGPYTVKVSGLQRNHVFTVRKALLRPLLKRFALVGVLCLAGGLTFLVAAAIVIVVALKRARARKQQTPAVPPQPRPAPPAAPSA